MSTYSNPFGFQSHGFDQAVAGEGKINYCVRWESSESVITEQRSFVETAVQRSFKKWIDELAVFDGWPYDTVDVSDVGWAVKDADLLQDDISGIQFYTTMDSEGAPQSDESCGRFFHQDGDYM